MRLGDLDVLKEMLIRERDAIPVTKTERYCFGVEMPNPHGMSMRGGINKAFKCMEKVPTIDAVPVVRCRDCKRGQVDDPENDPDLYYCELGCGWNKGYFFCAYGEKDGDGNG